MLHVHVRVNDAESGQPTPARIRFADQQGRYFPPLGRENEFPTGRDEHVGGQVILQGKRFAYIDGQCEIALPTAVPLELEISKGPLYTAIREQVTLGVGQLSLRFALVRAVDAAWNDVFSADGRCHFLTPHCAQLEARAEGLDLANLLAAERDFPALDGRMYRVTPNLSAFSGQVPALDSVVVNTFNTHPALGRLALLNCHRAVFPLKFGQVDETDDWSLADWCDQCHRKNGLTVWCDAYRPESGLPGGEALLDAILGKIDALEIDGRDRAQPFLPLWYRLLNAGIRLPIVGSSGKDSNAVALGSMRTVTPGCSTYAEWIEHVRAGRSFATNGPLLRWAIGGEHLATRAAGKNPRFGVTAVSAEPFEKLEIVANGDVIAATSGNVLEVDLPASGWIAARCWGANRAALYSNLPLFAHSSPVWIDSPGRQSAAVAALVRDVDGVRNWIENVGRFTRPQRRERLLMLCRDAQARLTKAS